MSKKQTKGTVPTTKIVLEGKPTKELKDRLTKLEEITELNVYETYNQCYAELFSTGLRVNLERLAVNKVVCKIGSTKKRNEPTVQSKKSVSKVIKGFIVGTSATVDQMEVTMSIAYSMFKKDPANAVEKGFTDKDGNPLDRRETSFGKPNKDKGKPLIKKTKDGQEIIPESYMRRLYMIGELEGIKGFKLYSITSYNKTVCKAWDNVHFKRACMTTVNVKDYGKPTMTLTASSSKANMTVFKPIKDEYDYDILFTSAIPSTTPFEDLELQCVENKKNKVYMTTVKGILNWVSTKREDIQGNYCMELADSYGVGDPVIVRYPKHLSIEFGQGSEVVVVGRLQKGAVKLDDGTYAKGAGAVEVIADIVYVTDDYQAPITGSSGTDVEEEEVSGWVEE